MDERLKYADVITLTRIGMLHPIIREQVREAYLNVNYSLLGKGVRLRFAYTHRSFQYQDNLFAQGRTRLFDKKGNRLGIVTNARGGQSIHNYGLAWDIVLLIDSKQDGSFSTASWDTVKDWDGDGIADWMEVVNHFKAELGAEWGGDWKKLKDRPHFQITFGYTWRELQQLVAAKQVRKELISGTWIEYPILSRAA